MGLKILYTCMSLDEGGSVLANQVRWVRALAGTAGVDHVTVLVPKPPVAELPDTVDVVETNARGWSRRRARKVVRFAKALRRARPGEHDIFFVAMGGGPYPALLAPAARWHRTPLVQWKADPVITRATRFYARWCDDLILTATTGSFPLDRPNVRVIGHGVDTNLFVPPAVSPSPTRDLVIVGRINRVKRIDSSIRALARVRETTGAAPSLDIIGIERGSGRSLEKELRRLVMELKLEDSVQFVGAVAYGDMPARLAGYRACIQLGETALDKAILEAMAVGLPIVTSNPQTLEALPESLRREVSVPPDDPGAQAATIRQMLNLSDVDRVQLGRRLRAVVVEDHSLSTYFPRVFEACADAGLLAWPPPSTRNDRSGARSPS